MLIPDLPSLWHQAGWLFLFCRKHRKVRGAFVSPENTCKSMNACRPENCPVKTNTVERALIGTPLRSPPGKLNSSPRCSALAAMGRIALYILSSADRSCLSSVAAVEHRPPCWRERQCFVWIVHLQLLLHYFRWLLQPKEDFQGSPLHIFSTFVLFC